jgi:hypothetical protein
MDLNLNLHLNINDKAIFIQVLSNKLLWQLPVSSAMIAHLYSATGVQNIFLTKE